MKNAINQKCMAELENNENISILNEDELRSIDGGWIQIVAAVVGTYAAINAIAYGAGYAHAKIEQKIESIKANSLQKSN